MGISKNSFCFNSWFFTLSHIPYNIRQFIEIWKNKQRPITTISTENHYLTLINVFTVDPVNQQKLVELLTRATADSVRKITGFISSSLHRSLDGTKVTMYAQWQSMEDYQNMRNNTQASPYLDEALKIATFVPGMYEVVETFLPESWKLLRFEKLSQVHDNNDEWISEKVPNKGDWP